MKKRTCIASSFIALTGPLLILLISTLHVAHAATPGNKPRVWTDIRQKRITATLVSYDDKYVRLRKSGENNILKVAIDRLSVVDRIYLRNLKSSTVTPDMSFVSKDSPPPPKKNPTTVAGRIVYPTDWEKTQRENVTKALRLRQTDAVSALLLFKEVLENTTNKPTTRQRGFRWLDQTHIFLLTPAFELIQCSHIVENSPLRGRISVTLSGKDGNAQVLSSPQPINTGDSIEIDVIFSVPDNMTGLKLFVLGAVPVSVKRE